jgi:hypothetical protein
MEVLIRDRPPDEAGDLRFEVHDLVRELTALAAFFIRLIHKYLQTLATPMRLARPLDTHVQVADLVLRHGRRKDDPELDQLHSANYL